jgi:hypothetical protein
MSFITSHLGIVIGPHRVDPQGHRFVGNILKKIDEGGVSVCVCERESV